MKQIILFSGLFFMSLTTYAQASACYEDVVGGSYWPIEAGMSYRYAEGQQKYTATVLEEQKSVDGKEYWIERLTYDDSTVKTRYWRLEDGAVLNYNEQTKVETQELIANPQVGMEWKSYDGEWTYKIISETSQFSTPFCDFENLLEVETTSKLRENKVYTLFYKKGVGLVGLNVNQRPYTFILPAKKMTMIPAAAQGCESQEDPQAIYRCNSNQVNTYIASNYQAKPYARKGKFIFELVIDKKGKVETVNCLESPERANKHIKQLQKLLLDLPPFRPAHFKEGKTIKSRLKLPIRFQ